MYLELSVPPFTANSGGKLDIESELDDVAIDLHARIKQAWDPAGILNPGKALPRW